MLPVWARMCRRADYVVATSHDVKKWLNDNGCRRVEVIYYGVEDYYIKFIADKTPALASLKNDQVDILDPQYQMQVDVPTIDPAWGKVILLEGTGRQEIGYNMRHPIYGTGVDTPLGKSDPSRAAEAAEYVRIAFDYAIPRQLIIDNLMAGFGQPGNRIRLYKYGRRH